MSLVPARGTTTVRAGLVDEPGTCEMSLVPARGTTTVRARLVDDPGTRKGLPVPQTGFHYSALRACR